MAVFNEKQEELEHFELQMGVPRGRLAVTMDLVTDAMALVGQQATEHAERHMVVSSDLGRMGKRMADSRLLNAGSGRRRAGATRAEAL